MTPKEKAKQLFDRFKNINRLCDFEGMDYGLAKDCALICVDNEYRSLLEELEMASNHIPVKEYSMRVIRIKSDWNEVKQEIEKT